jgi:hypothetical protein
MLSPGLSALLFIVFATLVRGDIALQPDSISNYVPNLAGNITFGILYTILSFAFYFHVFFTGKKSDKWGLVLPIGSSFEALGFWIRVALRTNQTSQPLYIVMYLFVVLSPAAFLAFNYILFGRFAAALEGQKPSNVKAKSRYSFLPPSKVKLLFVTSDVITFLIQASGGSLQTSHTYSTIQLGNRIFLAGTIIQTISYLLFTALVIVAHIRLHHDQDKEEHAHTNLQKYATRLFYLLYLSSLGILIRSCYRIVEFSQGYGGHLYSTEVSPNRAGKTCLSSPLLLTLSFSFSSQIFTFVLDGLPLVIAIGVWAIFWPGLLLRNIRDEALAGKQEQSTEVVESSNRDSVKVEEGLSTAA